MRAPLLTVVAILSLISSISALAGTGFQFAGLVGTVGDGFERIFLTPTDDGRIDIRTVDGVETVDPKVIRDGRGTDGSLELDLGKGRTLVVGSGFSADGKITFALKTADGKRIELNPQVFVTATNEPGPAQPKFLCAVNYVYSGMGPSAPLMTGRLESVELKDADFTYRVDTTPTNPGIVQLFVVKNSDPHLPVATATGFLRQSGDYAQVTVRKGDKDDGALFQCSRF